MRRHDEDLDGDNTLHASNVLESYHIDSFFAEAHPFDVQAPAPEERVCAKLLGQVFHVSNKLRLITS